MDIAAAVGRVGDAADDGEIIGDGVTAMRTRAEGSDRAEGADAGRAVDLLVEAPEDAAENAVGDDHALTVLPKRPHRADARTRLAYFDEVRAAASPDDLR